MNAAGEILTKIRGVDELVTEVSGASREHAQGISQINTAIRQMDKVTQSNAASAEEGASAAAEMNSQADSILESVGMLLRFVGAGSAAVTGYSAHDAGIGNADANGASDGPTDFGCGEGERPREGRTPVRFAPFPGERHACGRIQ